MMRRLMMTAALAAAVGLPLGATGADAAGHPHGGHAWHGGGGHWRGRGGGWGGGGGGWYGGGWSGDDYAAGLAAGAILGAIIAAQHHRCWWHHHHRVCRW